MNATQFISQIVPRLALRHTDLATQPSIRRFFTQGLMMGLLVSLLVGPGASLLGMASVAYAGSTKFVSVKGNVWVKISGHESKAKRGDSVLGGTAIRTDKSGSAEIRFDNGSLLKIRPNSSMRLSGTKRTKKKKSIMLFFGRLWSKVTKGNSRNYEVKTPNAVCGVRGTEFETAVGDDGSIRVRVDEGNVAVGEPGGKEASVDAGNEVHGNEEGVAEPMIADEKARWRAWHKDKRQRLEGNSRKIVDAVKGSIMKRKATLERLNAEQKELKTKRKQAEGAGDIDAIKKYNFRLAEVADQIADIGDMAEAQFGLIDHFADLANDPRFKSIDRKYLKAEAASLRRVKVTLDKLVAEGTDISMEAMDKMINDMSKGKGSLDEQSGSSAKDLFGDEDMDMGMGGMK